MLSLNNLLSRFRNKNLIILIIFITITTLLILLLAAIYIANNNISSKEQKLTDIMLLEQEYARLGEIQQIANTGAYTKMGFVISEIKNGDLAPSEEYKLLESLWELTIATYQTTGNPALYETQIVLNQYIIDNHPDENLINYKPLCFDEYCAENSQPQEIKIVIEQIQNSDLPEHIKENDIHNLQSFMYLNQNWEDLKADNYMAVADWIRIDPEYIKLGINDAIADGIYEYVENDFPNEYKEYIEREPITEKALQVTPAPENINE